jgi:hypothetical protein
MKTGDIQTFELRLRLTRARAGTFAHRERFSGTDGQALPNQFEDLNFSVHPGRRSNQCDLFTLEFDSANQVLADIVLNRRDIDVMGYCVTVERIPSRVRQKCLKGLGLLLHRSQRPERFPAPVADQSRHSAIASIGENTDGVRAVWSFASFSV